LQLRLNTITIRFINPINTSYNQSFYVLRRAHRLLRFAASSASPIILFPKPALSAPPRWSSCKARRPSASRRPKSQEDILRYYPDKSLRTFSRREQYCAPVQRSCSRGAAFRLSHLLILVDVYVRGLPSCGIEMNSLISSSARADSPHAQHLREVIYWHILRVPLPRESRRNLREEPFRREADDAGALPEPDVRMQDSPRTPSCKGEHQRLGSASWLGSHPEEVSFVLIDSTADFVGIGCLACT